MLVVKYEKLAPAAFISHIDTLRHIGRTLRRAEIDVEYSKGFNPHQLMYFSPPPPLGLSSVSEYMAIATNLDAEEFVKRFNQNSISGLKAICAYSKLKNPNFAAISVHATYEVATCVMDLNKLESAFLSTAHNITFMQKDVDVTKDVRAEMISYAIKGDVTQLNLAIGNKSLRADRFISSILKNNETTKILKTQTFVMDNANVVLNADEYIKIFN